MLSLKHTAAILVGALVSASACATMTGNDFLQLAKDSPWAAKFYAAGFMDASAMSGNLELKPPEGQRHLPIRICVPDRADPQQVVDVILQELEAHPGDRQKPLPTIAWFAIAKVWACPAR